MGSCSVKWCGKNAKTSSYKRDGITFHRFPKCPERKNKWIQSTFRGQDWFPSKTSVICSRHFEVDNFHIMKNRRRLMDSAVPTLYLPVLVPDPYTSEAKTISEINIHNPVSGTSSEKSVSNLPPPPQDLLHSLIDMTPSAYDTPVKKRLCRKIIELTNVVKEKQKKIKKIGDSNRRLKKHITSLKLSLLAHLEKRNFITSENIALLSSLGIKCSELVRRQLSLKSSSVVEPVE